MQKIYNIIFLVAACMFGMTSIIDAQTQDQTRVEDFPLSASSPESCDTIVETHKFKGTCCSLNTTQGNGCVLNVINGNCVIKGQYFTLDYTSTVTNKQCPPSEYSDADLMIINNDQSTTEAPGSSSSTFGLISLGTVIALFVAAMA